MKQFLQKTFGLRAWMIVAMLTALVSGAWAETVTYTISSKNTLSTTGTAPAGSTATIVETYSTSKQMTSGNSQTLTLSGFEGYKVTNITLSMKSNASKGAGNLSYSVDNGANFIDIVSTANFNSTSWNGSYSSSYVNISKDVEIEPAASGIIIKIAATVNSLYCESYTLTYTQSGDSNLDDSDFALTDDPVELEFDLYNNSSAQVISYTTSSTGAVTIADNDYAEFTINETAKTITVTPTAKTPSTQTITVNQAADDDYNAGSATFTLTITDSTPKTGGWVLTDLADLAAGDVFVIVGDNGKTYAMTNDKGTSSAPAAYAVTIENDEITSDVVDIIKWNISGNAEDGYVFYPNGSTTTWLYCIANNNGVRVGDNGGANEFTVADGYLKNVGQSRYVGIYNSADWRCYTSNTGNIANQTFSFYKYEDGSTTPSPRLSADNVEVAYDATTGSVAYTVTNGVDGGVVTAESSESWLTIGTVSANNVAFTCTTNSDASTRTATVTLTYTYNTSETVTKAVTVTQAGNPNVVMTISEARTQGTGSVVTKGIVTSCSGTTAYIQDADAAICVYGSSLTVGDEVKVEGTLTTYNGLLEITNPTVTVLSQNNTVTPEVMTIEQVNASTKQGWLVKIENATVTAISGQNTTIEQGNNTIVVRGISGVTYAVNDVLTFTANIGCYNTAQLANPTDVSVAVNTTPSIELSSNTIEATAAGADGTITVTYNNITTIVAVVNFCDANGDPATYDWIDAEINRENNNVDYVIGENTTTQARTAYFKVHALDDESNDVYSEIVTVTQEAYAEYTLTWTADNADLYVFDNDETSDALQGNSAQVLSGHTVYVSIDITGDYVFNQISVTTTEGAVAITEEEPGVYYSFTMPALATTITVTTKAKPAPLIGNAFVKVTSTAELEDGAYLIVYEDGGVAFDSSLDPLDAVNNTIDVTINNGAIAANDANKASVFTIESTNEGYTILAANGKYIGRSANSNGLDVSSDALNNTISFENDETVINGAGGTTLRFNSASNQNRFRYYKTGQQAISLYKLTTIATNYSRENLTVGYYGTICLPFGADIEGAKLYSIAGVDDTANPSFISLEAAATAVAGVPYIFEATATTLNAVFTSGFAATAGSNNGLVGSFVSAPLATGENLYVLKNNQIRPVGDNVTVGAYKAYIDMTAVPEYTGGSSNVKSIAIADLTDGINGIQTVNGQQPMYNIAGQRVMKAQKGIYIVGGKKVVVK